MDAIIILMILLAVAAGGWAIEWFKYRQLTAFLALRHMEPPTMEEWEKCAEIVWRSLFRRKK